MEPAGAGQSGEVVACLSSQYALVATKVREHLKLRAARSGPAGQQDGAGMNEGHMDPWVRELLALDVRMGRSRGPINGMRLNDADSLTRAAVTAPTTTAAVDSAPATAPVLSAEEEAAATASAAAAAVLASDLELGEDSLDEC